jgi:hypothetical protein
MPEARSDEVMRPQAEIVGDFWINAASYWFPVHYPLSAWLEHAPFGFWLVDELRPRSIVELGTHWGYSYFVFCEAVKRLGIDSTTFALDTWRGEEHAGLYGEEVFSAVTTINERSYSSFSTLLRGYFDDSLSDIEDGQVDLLHIDGRHGFADVSHDFEAWLPKLSDRAVVLFHDIAEHQPGFGVWQFWEQVSQRYPSFSFEHDHGLGVLGVGTDLPRNVAQLLGVDEPTAEAVRRDYEALGAAVSDRAALSVVREALEAEQSERVRMVAERDAEIEGLRNQLDELRASTSWTVTRPLRALGSLRHRD